MSKTPIIVVITCLLALAHQRGASQHYYGGGRAIPLKIDSSLVTVKFDPDFGTNAGEMLLASIDRVTGVIADEHAIDGFVACSLSTGEGYAGFLDSLTAIDGVYSVEPYYRNQTDSVFLVGTRFCVGGQVRTCRPLADRCCYLIRFHCGNPGKGKGCWLPQAYPPCLQAAWRAQPVT